MSLKHQDHPRLEQADISSDSEKPCTTCISVIVLVLLFFFVTLALGA